MCLCVFVYEHESHSVESDSLQPHGLYSPWNSPGQNTGVGSLSHLQGIFPIQRLNPGLQDCKQILYQLNHKGNPRILEWVKPIPAPEDLPSPGIEPGSSVLQVDSLPAEPPGKPKNTGVGSLSLLQWIFPTQELNCGPALQADSLPAEPQGKLFLPQEPHEQYEKAKRYDTGR